MYNEEIRREIDRALSTAPETRYEHTRACATCVWRYRLATRGTDSWARDPGSANVLVRARMVRLTGYVPAAFLDWFVRQVRLQKHHQEMLWRCYFEAEE